VKDTGFHLEAAGEEMHISPLGHIYWTQPGPGSQAGAPDALAFPGRGCWRTQKVFHSGAIRGSLSVLHH